MRPRRWIQVPRWTVLTVLSMLTATAHAETRKLDNDLALEIDSSLWVVKGKQRARLAPANAFKSLAVDKTKKKVVVEVTDNTCVGHTKHELTFAHLEARLENWTAYGLYQRRELKTAALGFERAARLDPAWRIPAYNLASAHQLLGDKAAAVAALAPWLSAEPIATFVHVASDPELAPLLVRPELAAIQAKEAGELKVTAQGFPTGYDRTRGLIAFARFESIGGGNAYAIDLQIYDAKTGALVSSTPLVRLDETDVLKGGLTKAGQQAVAARAQQFTTMLAKLGFSITKLERGAIREHDSQPKMMAHFAQAKLGVVATPDVANALRGNTRVGTVKSEGKMHTATYLEEANAVIVQTQRHAIEAGCDAGPELGVYVMPIK